MLNIEFIPLLILEILDKEVVFEALVDGKKKTVTIDKEAFFESRGLENILPSEADQFLRDLKETLEKKFANNVIDGIGINSEVNINHIANQRQFNSRHQRQLYKDLRDLRDKGETLGDIYYEKMSYNDSTSDYVFFRLVEEENNYPIKSVEELEKCLGVAEGEGNSDIERIFYNAMHYRYVNKIETLINNGAKYKDLLSVSPKEFNLSKSWKVESFSERIYNQQKAILETICYSFYLNEGCFIKPNLRDIATELDAPYSAILKAYQIGCNIEVNT